jgi:hypothetical protein
MASGAMAVTGGVGAGDASVAGGRAEWLDVWEGQGWLLGWLPLSH